VVEFRGRAMTKAGRPYNNTYCYVFRLADGQVAEITEYLDTQLVATALEAPAVESPRVARQDMQRECERRLRMPLAIACKANTHPKVGAHGGE
jgi:hypothetical protein